MESLRRGSRDNMTAVLVEFEDGTAYAEAHEAEQFVPGDDYHKHSGNSEWRNAFVQDAQRGGLSEAQLMKII